MNVGVGVWGRRGSGMGWKTTCTLFQIKLPHHPLSADPESSCVPHCIAAAPFIHPSGGKLLALALELTAGCLQNADKPEREVNKIPKQGRKRGRERERERKKERKKERD